MASPQVELGHLKIADELYEAILRASLSMAELKVIMAIMKLTYRQGKTRAQMSVDDLRYLTNLRKNQVEIAINSLYGKNMIYVYLLENDSPVLGVQKDFDRWEAVSTTKIVNTYINIGSINNNNIYNHSNIITAMTKIVKASPADQVINLIKQKFDIDYSVTAYRFERSKAKKLYTEVLKITSNPQLTLELIGDYADFLDDERFRAKVNYPVSYMLPGFLRWYKQLPKKTQAVLIDEEITGKRQRYNLRTKEWDNV